MDTWFALLRSAGLDPANANTPRTPFETVAACPTAEIVRDKRDDALWLLDFSGEPEKIDGIYDAPVRRATQADVEATQAAHERAVARTKESLHIRGRLHLKECFDA